MHVEVFSQLTHSTPRYYRLQYSNESIFYCNGKIYGCRLYFKEIDFTRNHLSGEVRQRKIKIKPENRIHIVCHSAD